MYLDWGCSSVGTASDQHTAEAVPIPQCGKGLFLQSTISADSLMVSLQPHIQPHAFTSSESTISADSLRVSVTPTHPPIHTPQSAITCIYICAHVKDSIAHVRVQRIMKTLKHSACTLGWVAWLCCSWLSLGKATWIFHGRRPTRTIRLLKK